MDKSKQADFVRRMGKKKLSRLKREHFDGGGIAGLLGSAGGAGGTGFDLTSGTTGAQINNAYNQNQTALAGTQNLANTLAPQAQNAVNAQNTLSGQYAQQAQGAGPNVAVNELNQATGANVANQAALMAGQRGAGANPALLARQVAMQGAQTQQASAGQAATLQAQQQIAAEGAQANLANNQIAQTQGATNANVGANQGEQGILQGANTANNNVTGQLANTTEQGQQGLIGGVMNGIGAATGLAHGGEVHKDKLDFVHKMTKMGLEHHGKPMMMADGGQVSQPTPTTAQQSAQDSMRDAFHYDQGGLTVPPVAVYQAPQSNFQAPVQVQGGFTPGSNAGAQAMGNSMKAAPKTKAPAIQSGAMSTNANITGANNDLVQSNVADVQAPVAGPDMGGSLMTNTGLDSNLTALAAYKGGEMHPHFKGPHKSDIANFLFAKGGEVPAMVSPNERYLNPREVDAVKNGANPLEVGQKIPGKDKVPGKDSRKNDTVPATLEEGGIVLPLHITKTMDPEKAKKFIQKSIAKKKAGKR
jgi:hypothetical protein